VLRLHRSVRCRRVSHASLHVYKSVDRRFCIFTLFDPFCSLTFSSSVVDVSSLVSLFTEPGQVVTSPMLTSAVSTTGGKAFSGEKGGSQNPAGASYRLAHGRETVCLMEFVQMGRSLLVEASKTCVNVHWNSYRSVCPHGMSQRNGSAAQLAATKASRWCRRVAA